LEKGENMMIIRSLRRINELAAKARNAGLTEEEIKERANLRQEYLREIRGQVNLNLASVTIINGNGEDVTPESLVVEKARQYQKTIQF
jgi:uncharacterized protein YnzC (UPF0291/DUF896 family)